MDRTIYPKGGRAISREFTGPRDKAISAARQRINHWLTERRARDECRHIITSPWYQRLWGHRLQLLPDQNQKTRFGNVQGGHRISTSEGGVITGEGADIIVFDDPHNVRDIAGASDVA